jgi:S1-C subfamily serine protease
MIQIWNINMPKLSYRLILIELGFLVCCSLLPINHTECKFSYASTNSAIQIEQAKKKALNASVSVIAGNSIGSGTIINANGTVITSEHVVRNIQSDVVKIFTLDGREYFGKVLVINIEDDLALVQIVHNNEVFPFLQLANPESIKARSNVIVVGSPLGVAGTISQGVVNKIGGGEISAKVFLQLGNSGGPWVNTNGELIGISKDMPDPAKFGKIRLGFAVSVNVIQNFLVRSQQALASQRQNSNYISTNRPNLGITVNPETLQVISVISPSIAFQYGIASGDTIVAINGFPIINYNQILNYLNAQPPIMVLTINRGSTLFEIPIRF